MKYVVPPFISIWTNSLLNQIWDIHTCVTYYVRYTNIWFNCSNKWNCCNTLKNLDTHPYSWVITPPSLYHLFNNVSGATKGPPLTVVHVPLLVLCLPCKSWECEFGKTIVTLWWKWKGKGGMHSNGTKMINELVKNAFTYVLFGKKCHHF